MAYDCHTLENYATDDETGMEDIFPTYTQPNVNGKEHTLTNLEVSLLKLTQDCLLSKRVSNAIIKWYNTIVSAPYNLPCIRGMDALRREMDKVASKIETKSVELNITEGITSWTSHTIQYRDPIQVRLI